MEKNNEYIEKLVHIKRITKVVIGINSRKNLAKLNNIKENNKIYPQWFKLKDKNLLNPSNW